MLHGCTDGRSCIIINVLISSPLVTVFLRFVDASSHVKDAQLLFQLLDLVIMEVGVTIVVHVIIDNAYNYVAARNILEEKHPTIFWTGCVAYCLDLIFEDIGKLD